MKNFLLAVFLGLAFMVSTSGSESLSADSTTEDATHALNRLVDLIMQKGFDYNSSYAEGLIYQTNPSTSAAAAQLRAVSPKVLIDVLNQIRPYDRDSGFDPRLVLKRQVLFKALMNTATDADLPDLLASPSAEALWVVAARTSWNNNPAVTSFLAAQLPNIPSNSADDLTPDWIANDYIPYETTASGSPGEPALRRQGGMPGQDWMPSQTWEWTVLDLAILDEDPATQKLLVDTIQRALASPDTRTIFFTNALDVISRSNNPGVIAQGSSLLAQLNHLGKFPYYRVSASIRRLIEGHSDLLKDETFDHNALSCLKESAEDSGYYNNILLARLGDPKAFIDVLSDYDGKGLSSGNAAYQKSVDDEIDSELLRTVVYHGSGNRLQGIRDHYRTAEFKEGQWIVTAPDDTAQNPDNLPILPSPTPVSRSAPPANPYPPVIPGQKPAASPTNNIVAIPSNPPPAPPAATAAPTRVIITIRAPIETLDGSGHVTAMTMAAVGGTYRVVRMDGNFYILQDASGTQYRITAQATSALPDAGATVPPTPVGPATN